MSNRESHISLFPGTPDLKTERTSRDVGIVDVMTDIASLVSFLCIAYSFTYLSTYLIRYLLIYFPDLSFQFNEPVPMSF